MGPVIDCQLIETALLNLVNFQTLVATKTARVKAAEGHPSPTSVCVAQGLTVVSRGARILYRRRILHVQRACGKIYGIPVFGTHAHSWVMAFSLGARRLSRLRQVEPQELRAAPRYL